MVLSSVLVSSTFSSPDNDTEETGPILTIKHMPVNTLNNRNSFRTCDRVFFELANAKVVSSNDTINRARNNLIG